MNKQYKVVLLVKNQYDYIHTRFCNDLESRKYRLKRDGYTIITHYEHSMCIDKSTLCEQLLQTGQNFTDEEYNTVVRARDKHQDILKKLDRSNNLKGTTVQDIMSAIENV